MLLVASGSIGWIMWIIITRFLFSFFFQAEDGIFQAEECIGLGDVYRGQEAFGNS